MNGISCNSLSRRTQDLLDATKVKTYTCSKKVALLDVLKFRKMLHRIESFGGTAREV